MPKTRQESFRILQLPENASEEEVKRAYKQKARELHPDKNPDDPNATKKFQELSEAYQRIVSGTLDEEELPDEFFIDPFELFFKVMLIKRMQQEQARSRRRFVRSFGGLFVEVDDDDEDLNFGFGFPFGGFAFTPRSYNRDQRPSSGYRQARAEERTRFNNSSGNRYDRYHRNSPERRESSRWQNKSSSRDFSSHTSGTSEKHSKSRKTNEPKRSTKPENGKENEEKNVKTPQSATANTGANLKGNEKTATKSKKKLSQQTSNAWQKGKKGSKGGKKYQPQSVIKKTSKDANENNEDIVKETMNQPVQDFQESEGGCSRDSEVSCDANSASEEVSHSTESEVKNSAHININDVEIDEKSNDKLSKSEFTTTSDNKSKKCDSDSERNELQASVEQNDNSADTKLEDIEERGSELEETDISFTIEETIEACAVNDVKSESKEEKIRSHSPKCEFCVPHEEGSTVSAGARPKVKSEQTSLRKGVSSSSNSGRSQEPKKNRKKKKYVNPKFQNLQKISPSPKLSDLASKQPADTILSTDSDEKNLVIGKGFRWNKATEHEPEGKGQWEKNNTKDKNSTKVSQMKRKEAEEVQSVISEAPNTDQKESVLCDNSHEYSSSKPIENTAPSVDELYGNLKYKKSKTEGRKQNQSNQYYFAKGYSAKTGSEHSVKASRSVCTGKMYNRQDYTINNKLNGNSIQNCYQSNRNCEAADVQRANYQGSYLQANNSFHQNFPDLTTIQNIRVENHQNDYQKQNQKDPSVKREQEHSANKTRTHSWLQRELKRKQLYNMTPKNSEDEQMQLEMALAMSREQAA